VEPGFDERDVTASMNAAFDLRANLARAAVDVRVIRLILEDGDEEEEEEDQSGGDLDA
jgi:hypothetical protein